MMGAGGIEGTDTETTMPSNEYAEITLELTPDPPLAEVIQMPPAELPSFYARNSGGLPRLASATASDYGRAALPSPIAAEPDTLVSRIKDFISLNRPGWLPQR
jgi:hypothetical protein